MSDNKKILIERLASNLCLQYRAVKRWVKINRYNDDQLRCINTQIVNNDIYIPTLIGAIMNDSKYDIYVYC